MFSNVFCNKENPPPPPPSFVGIHSVDSSGPGKLAPSALLPQPLIFPLTDGYGVTQPFLPHRIKCCPPKLENCREAWHFPLTSPCLESEASGSTIKVDSLVLLPDPSTSNQSPTSSALTPTQGLLSNNWLPSRFAGGTIYHLVCCRKGFGEEIPPSKYHWLLVVPQVFMRPGWALIGAGEISISPESCAALLVQRS